MGAVRLVTAPIRYIANSRLFQFAFVLAVILLLDHYSFDYAVLAPIAQGLKDLVTATVALCSDWFRVGILTDPVLQVGLMIAYVYVVCLVVFLLLRLAVRALIDLVGVTNLFWLRSTIARERGIAAYKAWEPLERIRPKTVPQQQWEETYAWPADNRPPYPPLRQRLMRGALSTLLVIAIVAVLLQLFTPFPVLTWLGRLIG
jgi:hypothetical protein